MRSPKRWLRRQLLKQVQVSVDTVATDIKALRDENVSLSRRVRDLERQVQRLDQVAREGRRLGRASARSLETLMQREVLLRRDLTSLAEFHADAD